MNNFATIKHITSFKKVEFYSVCLEQDDDISLFELFVNKHTVENKEKLNHIMKWINIIGDKFSAKNFYFRNEAETSDTGALPPIGRGREPTYIELNKQTGESENVSNNLRLYCFRVSDNVVFLYNGDIKTARTAQECDNVRSHFRDANTITAVIESRFRDGINWNKDFTDIEIEENFELNW